MKTDQDRQKCKNTDGKSEVRGLGEPGDWDRGGGEGGWRGA